MERNPGGGELPTPERREGLHINSIVIPADDEQPLRQSELSLGGLADRQQLVGGYIQAVNLGEPPARLYFNEDGKQIGMPPNKRATLLLWLHNPAFRHMDFIVGDAFVVGPVGRRSTDTSAPTNTCRHSSRPRSSTSRLGRMAIPSGMSILNASMTGYRRMSTLLGGVLAWTVGSGLI